MQPALLWGWLEDYPKVKDLFFREVVQEDCYQKYFKVEEGDIVVDIGASVGIFPYKLAESKPKEVYCIEPDTNSGDVLLQNAKNLKFPVSLFSGAITKYDRRIKLSTLINPETTNFPNPLMNDKLPEVQGISFRSFCDLHGITHIDFLKTDCEGGEYSIFTESNFEWIVKNVSKVAGEWHLSTEDMRENFHRFAATYLSKARQYTVLTMKYEDVTDKVLDYAFMKQYRALQVYIVF